MPRQKRGNDRGSVLRLSDLRELLDCEQVAAVCYRVRKQAIEFLLVRTRGGRRWTFPKGSAEPGLTHAQAAALEAFEEAGVRGRIEERSFGRYSCEKRKGRGRLGVNAHLCEVLRLVTPKESDRDRTWFVPEDAKQWLRRNRQTAQAAELARILDLAVACIEGAQQKPKRSRRARGSLIQELYREKDALRTVHLEAATRMSGRQHWGEIVPSTRIGAPLQPPEFTVAQTRKLLPADILPFSIKPPDDGDSKPQPVRKKAMAKAFGQRFR